MSVAARRRRAEDAPYWPGFVDAMAQLLLVITFLLSIFIVAQFLLARRQSVWPRGPERANLGQCRYGCNPADDTAEDRHPIG